MFVGVVAFDLHIPHVRSLKAKRAVVRPLIEAIRNRYHCSVAEVDHHDLWQRAEIGVAVVSATYSHGGEVLDDIERFVWANPEIEVSSAKRSWLDDVD